MSNLDGSLILGVSFDPASYSAAQRQLQNLSRKATVDLKVNSAPLGRINADLHEFDKSLQAANARVLAFGASTGAVYGIGRAFTEIIRTFVDVEARFKSIEVVLRSTTSTFNNFKGEIFSIGRETGKSFQEVTDAAQELARQGLKVDETLRRTSDAMILSRQSGLSATEAVTSLTAALNTFNQEALTSTQVINKLANVDANFAVSQKDLIDAISRSGSAAQDARVNFDKLLALTTSLQQTTARGGAVIGNALKSIFTRIERSSTLEALEQFNIQTRDLQGNVLSADQLLQNLAKTYKTLASEEKNALSSQVAGIQQINQLKALLSDLARANSIYSQALDTSKNSVNEAIERNKSLNDSLKTTLNTTKLNAISFSETVGKLALAPALKLPLGSANAVFDIFSEKDQESKSTGQKIGEGILKGIGSVLSGPGLVLATAIVANTLRELGRFTLSVVSDYSSLNNKTKEQANIQHAINSILSEGNSKYASRLAAARTLKEEEAAIKAIMIEQNSIVFRQGAANFQATRNIALRGGNVAREGTFQLPKKPLFGAASGYLPIQEEYNDVQRGVGGATKSARPAVIPNFNFGGGKRGTIVANTDEYIVPNFQGSDGSAVFNREMVQRYGLPQGAQKVTAASGFIPNYNKLLGSGDYGSFYDLNRKFRGVDIGKKVFHSDIGGYSGDPVLKQAYTEKHITDEFIAAKVLENLSKSGQLPPNVSAPQIFGSLEGALKNKSIYKQVVRGSTGGDLSSRFEKVLDGKRNISAEDWARADGGQFFAGNIASYLENHLTDNLGIQPMDLHAGNYMMTPALSRQLGMFISTNPQKAKAIGGGSQEDFEKFFLPILKQKDNGLSIFDSGELRVFDKYKKNLDLRKIAGLAEGFVPNFADKLLRSEAIAKILAAKNKMFGAEFTKRTTGESRTGTFRLARNVKAGKVGGSLPYNAKGHKLVPVFDMGLAKEQGAGGSYRMLPYEGLNKLNIDGKEYDVVDQMARGFIPNFADNLLTDHSSFTTLEKLLGRVMGFNLVPTTTNEGGKKFSISDEELKALKLKGRTFDVTGNFEKSVQNDGIYDPIFSKKSVGNLLTQSKQLNFDKFRETKISAGLPESHRIIDLFKAAGITPSTDPIILKQQVRQLATDKFGAETNIIYKGVKGLQGNQVYMPEMLDLKAVANYKDLIVQRGIVPQKGDELSQFFDEFRVDVVGGRKGVFGSIPLLKSKREYSGKKTLSGAPVFTTKFNQHIEKYNLGFLRSPIKAFQALKHAYSAIKSIDPKLRAGAAFGVDTFPSGAIELNPTNQYGISGSAGTNLFSSLMTARGLKKASKENVNYFTNRGKEILGLSGQDQEEQFKKFNRELLGFQKHDQYGYLKTAKELNKLGFGITVGKGRGRKQIGGSEAAGLFERLGFAGGYIPNFKNPLISAIARERAAGLPLSQIKIENHPSLISHLNPGGLAVTNQRDEPGGIMQGIARAKQEGRNPKTYGIPNFAPPPQLNLTPQQLENYGKSPSNNYVRPAIRKAVSDFTRDLKLDPQDLHLPFQDIKNKIKAGIVQSMKLDPRTVNAQQGAGLEKVAENIIQANQKALADGMLKYQKSSQDKTVVDGLVQKALPKIQEQNSLLFGNKRNAKLIREIQQSNEYKGLSVDAQRAADAELRNYARANQQERRGKLQSRALGVSFGAPVLAGALTSQLNPNDPLSKRFAGITEGVSTGLSVAAITGFSVPGLIAGAAIGGASTVSSLAKSRRKSQEELNTNLTNARGRLEESRNSVLGVFQGQDTLKEAIAKGASLGQVRSLSSQITGSITGIDEVSLRNKVIAAQTDEERAAVLNKVNKIGLQKVARTGLEARLEEVIEPNRGFLSDATGRSKNIVLKPKDINEIGSLVAGAAQLKFDDKGNVDEQQLAALKELSKKSDFNIDDVEKVLGSLKISRESRNQIGQLTTGDQKLIARNAVEKNLSLASIDKSVEGLVKFNNLLLRVGKTLDTISNNLDFKFQLQNIDTAGVRNRAIAGASQSLAGLSDYLSPKAKNQQENIIGLKQIENDRVSAMTEASTTWVNGFRNLENTISEAAKGGDDGSSSGGISPSGEPLRATLRKVLVDVATNASSNPVSASLEGKKLLEKIIANTSKADDPSGKLVKAMQDTIDGINKQISVIDKKSDNDRAALNQATKNNELIISLKNLENFLGGGNFESRKNLDFSKIEDSARLTRAFKNDETNPFKNRIYKSRGNSFDDFFKGKQIDVQAETARRADNLGTIASGGLELFKLGLFNDDPENTSRVRGQVAEAEKAQLENKLNELEKIFQNSGDFKNLEIIRNKQKSGIVDQVAAVNALKQVPIEKNEPIDQISKAIGGPFAELSGNIINLNETFSKGVQGNFKELSDQAKEAATHLTSLNKALTLKSEFEENEKQAKKQLDKTTQIGVLNTDVANKNQALEILKNKIREEAERKTGGNDIAFIRDRAKNQTIDLLPGKSGLGRIDLTDDLTGGRLAKRNFYKILEKQGINTKEKESQIEELIGATKAVSTPGSNFTSFNLAELIKKSFPGQERKVIDSILINNGRNWDSDGVGFDPVAKNIKERLVIMVETIGSFASQIERATKALGESTNNLETVQLSPDGKSRGLIPNYSGGLSKSFLQEKRDILNRVGGARPGDSPYITHLNGVGPAVVNTGEQIIRNYAGGGKDAVFNRKMMNFAGGLTSLEEMKRIAERYTPPPSDFFSLSLSRNINNSINSLVGRPKEPKLEDFEDTVNRSEIFGEKYYNASAKFNTNFANRGGGYKRGDMRAKMDRDISSGGSPFKPISIQGSGPLVGASLEGSQRFGAKGLSLDQKEQDFKRTQQRDDARFDKNIRGAGRGGQDGGSGGNSSLKTTLDAMVASQNKLTAALATLASKTPEKLAGEQPAGQAAEIKHDINVNVNVGGEVNTQDARVKAIIDEETKNFKTNIEARIKALEGVVKPPAVPPTAPPGQ